MPLFPRYHGPPLIDQIVSVENLTLAWRRVRSNIKLALRDRSAGPDAVTLRDFEADWARQMGQLAEELRDGSYRPLPPRRVTIPKMSGGERAIAILAVRDRIAQRAVHQVLEPLFDAHFLDCSYGCRPALGVTDALARVVRYAERGFTWVVDADLSNYFDSLDQRIVLGLVRQRVDEIAVLQLIARWLAAGAWQSGEAEPLTDLRDTLLVRAQQFLQRALSHEDGHDSVPMHEYGGLDTAYAEGWPPSTVAGPAYGPWSPRPAGLESKLWTAAMLARPVVRGTRQVLPYVQRLGGRRLAVAGAVAVGALAAGEMITRQRGQARRGAVQGGALSPLLANIYLHPFDVVLTSHGLRLVRFMDDFVIMCAGQTEAEQALQLAQRQLAALHLTLNADKTRIISYADGLEFLGETLAPRSQGRRLGAGLTTFTEAEQALQSAAANVRRKLKKR